jgi:hypothetical protein
MLAGSPHDRSGVGRQGGTGDRSQPRHRAATARGRGPRRDVLLTYLRLHLAAQAGETAYPAEYDHLRAGTAEHLVEQIRGAAACMSAAQELGPYGVSANMVYPPVTDTGWVTPAVEQAATAASPLLHLAHPDDADTYQHYHHRPSTLGAPAQLPLAGELTPADPSEVIPPPD